MMAIRSMRSKLYCFVSVLILLTLVSPAHAVIEDVQFEDASMEQRYQTLIAELRCLVCQNQNLADSDADLAKDLRRKTAEMLRAGNSDAEILEYMRERYGDFVLYRPPFTLSNALLWIGPFLLLFIVAFALLFRIRRRQTTNPGTTDNRVDEDQRRKVRELLKQDPTQQNDSHQDH